MSLEAEKTRLRRNVHFVRSTMGPEQIAKAEARIAEHVSRIEEFARARTLALYAATEDELDIRAVFDLALEQGKCCVFPRCIPGNRLEFAAIRRWDDLEPGRYGILEPRGDEQPFELSRIDLVLVPGLAFDQQGGRLGRGAGYYDRTFPADADFRTVLMGVAHSVQLFEAVPMGEHDRRMHLLALETGILRIEGGNPGAVW